MACAFHLIRRLITFWLLWKYRKRMEENVATALGDEIVNPADRKALIWKAWKTLPGEC
jgi:hypothetical protein